MEKSHLKIKYHKRGLYLKKDCVTNMTVLCHEYRGGCISREGWVGVIQGVNLTYLFASPLFRPHMLSRHCTAAAVL